MVVSSVLLLRFGLFTVDLLYLLTFLSLVINVYLLAPADRSASWYVTLVWLTRLGFLVLIYIVFLRVSALLQF